jgi:hypothetical protein
VLFGIAYRIDLTAERGIGERKAARGLKESIGLAEEMLQQSEGIA